ncbi:MAG TPA: hypothetical protein VKS20_02490 [Candidatus Acidoferrales bacterium]|nr:hypothetical protein [Candidatus Acidoferrales bacterium]
MDSKLKSALTIAALVVFVAMSRPRTACAAPPTDACSLLTTAQVSAVLDVKVGPGERLVPTSPKLCGYGGAGAAKRVVVAIINVSMFTQEKTPLEGIKEEIAAGIGDEAHYMTTPGFGTGLSVKKGNFAFKVRVYGFPLDQVKAKEKTLAKDILAKL